MCKSVYHKDTGAGQKGSSMPTGHEAEQEGCQEVLMSDLGQEEWLAWQQADGMEGSGVRETPRTKPAVKPVNMLDFTGLWLCCSYSAQVLQCRSDRR